ncbi:unnamed protein product [Lymnaea stagnalis]|uniref:LRRCT domain-containing protein n=1 Tax=Lymnaea stagnalis TaxID=6523 RepID=A0AAV2HT69_LYMST
MMLQVTVAVLLLLAVLHVTYSVERGFVYCPAYPCTCESKDGALIINCRNLYLSSLPKFLSFDGRVKELSLSYNSIRSLPARGFEGLHIEKLDLLDNAVTSVHEDAFLGLENSLASLSIQLYALEGLPTLALSRLKHLRSLHISGCKQQELYTELFRNLRNLEELQLIGCRIAHIQPGAFALLTNLKRLVLAGNSIRFQHIKEINSVENLTDLDLSSNDIQLLDNHAIAHLTRLRRLSLANNKMIYMAGGAFYNLDFSLEELDLHDNALNEEALKSLRYLKTVRHLDLSSNNISSLSGEEFIGLRYLTWLSLAHNDIAVVVQRSFAGIASSLVRLDVHANPLELIEPGAFSDFMKLEYLNLNNTYLGGTLKSETFSGLTETLNFIDLSRSEIISGDLEAISHLSSLNDIDLSFNRIDRVHLNLFKGLRRLVSADLSNNTISEFLSGSVSKINSSLRFLDLSRNRLHTITDCAFFVFKDLSEVRLEENPLSCNCSLSWLFRWLQLVSSGPNEWTNHWRCASASKGAPKKLFSELEFVDFKCVGSSAIEPSCLMLYNLPWRTETTARTTSPTTPASLHILSLNITHPNPVSLHVKWATRAGGITGGYRVVLKRCNDSFEIESVSVSPDTTSYTFSPFDRSIQQEACITMLDEDLTVVQTKCEGVNIAAPKTDMTSTKEEQLYTLIHGSFIPLLLIYIAGSMALAFIVACLVICVRKRRSKPVRIDPFYPGYPAWMDQRSSVSSLSLTPDPHLFNTFFFEELGGQEQRDYHAQSTLVSGVSAGGRTRAQSPLPRELPRDMPNIQISRRSSRTPSCVPACPYECATLNATTIPKHLAAEILAGRAEIDEEFYFHF